MRYRKDGGIALSVLVMLLVVSAGAVLLPRYSEGAVLYVGPTSTHATITSALENASSGDTIIIGPGRYNESIVVKTNLLTIRGNGTNSVTVEPYGNTPSEIMAPFISLSGMTFRNHSLRVNSDNVTLTSLTFDLRNGTGLIAEKVGFLTADDITFKGSPDVCIYAANSSILRLSRIRPSGTERAVVETPNVTGMVLSDLVWDLTGIDNGALVLGSNVLIVDSVLTSSSNTTGIDFQGYDLKIRNVVFSLRGSSFRALGDRIDITNTSLSMRSMGDLGIDITYSSNITLNRTKFDIGKGGMGIDLLMVSDLLIHNSSVDLGGGSAVFINGSGLTKGSLMDLIAVCEGDSHDLLRLGPIMDGGIPRPGARGLIVANSKFFLNGDGSDILRMADCRDTVIEKNLFVMNGNASKAVEASGAGYRLDHNSFSLRTGSSIGIELDSQNSTIEDQSFVIEGEGAVGVVMGGRGSYISNSTFSSFSESVEVVMAGERNHILGSYLYANGPGRCLAVSDSKGCSVNLTMIEVLGSGSDGIFVTRSDDLRISNSDIRAGALAGLSMRSSPGDTILIENTLATSNASGLVMDLKGDRLEMEGVHISAPGTAVRAMGMEELRISMSRVPGLIVSGSVGTVTDSDLRSPGNDLTVSASTLDLLDSLASEVDFDMSSTVRASSTIVVRAIDEGADPIPSAQLRVRNDLGTVLYETTGLGGTDPPTDPTGKSQPFVALDRIYGAGDGVEDVVTSAELHVIGTAIEWNVTYVIECSSPATIDLLVGDIDLPSIPQNLRVRSVGSSQVLMLQWDPNSDDTSSYHIYESMSGNWTMVGSVDHPSTSWVSPDLGPDHLGIYRVAAYDGTWESAPSDPAQNITVDLTPPDPPVLDITGRGVTSLTLSWEIGPVADLGGFIIEMNSTASMTQFKIVGNAGPLDRSLTINGLSPETLYGFRAYAFDLSGNPSEESELRKGSTLPQLYSISVHVHYYGGPQNGGPSSGALARLLTFNGSLIANARCNDLGGAIFEGLRMDEIYQVEATPDISVRGIEGLYTGYIENTSNFFETSGPSTQIEVDILLPYYVKPTVGSISAYVSYGEGPRSGAVFNALVELRDSDGAAVENRTTDELGQARFTIRKLPFEGSFRVVPPDSVAAIPGRKAGYLYKITNEFNVTEGLPDWGTFQVVLEYMDYETPPGDLLVIWKSPTGRTNDLDDPIRITFNQPVLTASVEAYTTVKPVPKGMDLTWSNNNQTLAISHDGLAPDRTYTVTVGISARSEEGAAFPEAYTNNTWTFETYDAATTLGLPREVIYAIIALISIVLIGLGIFFFLRRPKKEDLEFEEEPDPYSYDYLDEDQYDPIPEEEGPEDTIPDEGPPEDGGPVTDLEEFPDEEPAEEEVDSEPGPEDEMLEDDTEDDVWDPEQDPVIVPMKQKHRQIRDDPPRGRNRGSRDRP